jgi:death on curing protein
MNQWHYENARLPALAAAYAFSIARNHPFVDGNKRAAFAAMMAFLRLNAVPFRPAPPAATAIMHELAAGKVGEDGLTHWIEDNWPTGR